MDDRHKLFSIESIAIRSGPNSIISSGNLSVARGATTALVGASGAGKTLTATAIVGLETFVAPTINFDLRIRWPFRPKSELVIGYVPQGTADQLHPYVRIRQQLHELTAAASARKRIILTDANFADILSRLRFTEPERVLRSYPHELSGGMRQRILLAIALLSKPDLIVLDEPTSALDGMARAAVYSELESIQRLEAAAVLLITHNRFEAFTVAQTVFEIRDKAIVELKGSGPIAHSIGARVQIVGSEARMARRHPTLRGRTVALSIEEVSIRPSSGREIGAIGNFQVRSLSSRVCQSGVLAIIGETGCGKTTAIRGLAQLATITDGKVRLGDVVLNALGSYDLRMQRKRFQVLFQDSHLGLNPFMSVSDLFLEPARIHRLKPPSRDAIADVLHRFGLESDVLARKSRELSHGQRQRIALSRLLVGFPNLEVLLMDEPLSGLDFASRTAMVAMLDSYRSRGVAIVFASHDLDLVDELSDELLLMKDGQVVEAAHGGTFYLSSEYGRMFRSAFSKLA